MKKGKRGDIFWLTFIPITEGKIYESLSSLGSVDDVTQVCHLMPTLNFMGFPEGKLTLLCSIF